MNDAIDTRPGDSAILREVNQLRADLGARHEETVRRLEARAEVTDGRLAEILAQTKITNGRVSEIEKQRAIEAALAERDARDEADERSGSNVRWGYVVTITASLVSGGAIGALAILTRGG